MRQRLESPFVVAGARDRELGGGVLHLGECANDQVHPLVALETTQVDDERHGRSFRGCRGVRDGVDAGVDHLDAGSRNTPRGEIIGGAFADGLEGHVAIDETDRSLLHPDRTRHRRRDLLKRRRAEEMRHEGHRSLCAPSRGPKRNLVDVLHQHICTLLSEHALVVAARDELEGVPRSYAMHVDPVECRALRRARPTAPQQRDLVPARRQPAEDLVQMNLGAAGVRILAVLPIDDEHAH
ncbi:MAG: hypothetical protein M3Y30_06965 [Gemmatimonadota bacterium]|nr:hypothetical protein [Gemmatimonadota bacterium]